MANPWNVPMGLPMGLPVGLPAGLSWGYPVIVNTVKKCAQCGKIGHWSDDCPYNWCRFCDMWVRHTAGSCMSNPANQSDRDRRTNSYARSLGLDPYFNSDASNSRKYCTSCGSRVPGEANFCGQCGTSV